MTTEIAGVHVIGFNSVAVSLTINETLSHENRTNGSSSRCLLSSRPRSERGL